MSDGQWVALGPNDERVTAETADQAMFRVRRSVEMLARGAVSLVSLCLLAGWAAAEIPRDVARDRCDLAETNFFYDAEGRLTFCQLVFWRWSDDAGDYQCQAWRLVKGPQQTPQRDARGGYVIRWMDGELLREVRTGAATVSHTQVDVEVADRERLPKEMRRELSPPPTVRRAKP